MERFVKKTETIIFWDLGSVMIDIDKVWAAKELSSFSSLTLQAILDLLSGVPKGNQLSRAINDFDEGKFSDIEFFDIVSVILSLKKINLAQFRTIWVGVLRPNRKVIDISNRIDTFIRQGIISNLNRMHQAFIFKKFLDRFRFDIPMFSYVEQILKPNPEFYERAIRAANTSPKNIMFIDDREDNILSAINCGIWGYRFLGNTAELQEEIDKFLSRS